MKQFFIAWAQGVSIFAFYILLSVVFGVFGFTAGALPSIVAIPALIVFGPAVIYWVSSWLAPDMFKEKRPWWRSRFEPRQAAAFGAGFAVWWFCGHLEGYASAQTGMTVPVDLQVTRDVVRWLWLPFSWLPSPIYINDTWSIVKRLLIGVPYGLAVGLVVLWLFRTGQPKKI